MVFALYDWILLILFLFALLYVYFAYKWSFFRRRGVKTMPIFKSMMEFILRKEHFIEAVSSAYKTFPEEK